ncbi:MAG: exodeoxyribonuclease VII small subunit [Clostridiales bacterium]|nr:exodeoxyribonuclease VII small subunit [Clostridiales bacterium]
MKNDELTYEKAIKRLEEIADALEKNDVPLDDSIKLFEEGATLASFCADKLNSAKQKITQLNKE